MKTHKKILEKIDEICMMLKADIKAKRQKMDYNYLHTFIEAFIAKQELGTIIIPLLTSVLYDPRHWENPYQFNPNHFLDAEGKFVKKEAFVPFSIGRRVCVGESLVKMELFIFFTGLLQKFTFSAPPGISECDLVLDADPCFTIRPQPHLECCAEINFPSLSTRATKNA